MLWSETCLRGKIATLVFGANVGIAPQLKQKRNSCAGKKWRRFAVLFFGYICLEPSNFAKFLRTPFLIEHLLLLELTHDLMISISISWGMLLGKGVFE